MAEKSKYFISLDRKLFLSAVSMFLVFVSCFIIYQFQRERTYKIDMLNHKLQDYNKLMYKELQENNDSLSTLNLFIDHIGIEGLRITVIDLQGNIIFDNSGVDYDELENHLERKEIQEAIEKGTGYAVRRVSKVTGITYFYSAKRCNKYILRTAVPYNTEVRESLKTDMHYIWFSIIIALILIFIFYKLTRRLGKSIDNLKNFALCIEKNAPFYLQSNHNSSYDELDEISQHIMQIYQRLLETKEELNRERDKLIAHLQTSKEGLGVFSHDKKEILVNNLFIQYINFISDYNLRTTEETFGITELQPITDFINRMQKKSIGKEDKRMSLNFSKNGRNFMVECIIFQDHSFEITINDITLEEEQSSLKRKLTQNIAHELKTPVSSIQGYLETLVFNEDIDPQKAKTFLLRCYEQSNRLSKLLRDISVLTRMDEAANMLEIEQVDITNIVEVIINEEALEIDKKQIKVINNLKRHIHIRGNYSLIYSIFRNLMDNAIAYGGNEIQIIINCFREDDNFYYFSFADTGVGVSTEHLQRLFERFYRIDKGRSRKLGGTGLGLAIVKNAVLIHGGKISAKHYQGGGLEFIFTLAKDR